MSTELAVAMPLFLFMVMLVVQAGVWLHATHIAQASATRAANAAAAYNSTAVAGEVAGQQTLTALGDGVLTDSTVNVSRTATDVRAEVTGTAATVVPGIRWHARAVITRPVERFVPVSRQLAASEQPFDAGGV